MKAFALMVVMTAVWGVVGEVVAADKPNVLIILADDCTFNDLPAYGGQNAKTPHLDRLAKESLTFQRAFLAEAMCQPCRSELYTGLYPMRNGCAWNHSASHGDIESMPQHFGRLGYRVGLSGKVHVTPRKTFPFEKVGGFDPNCVRSPTQDHDIEGVKAFVNRDETPFCLVVALVEPHVPWVMGDASAYPPKSLKLPPNIADTPDTRVSYSKYLAEITYMDSQVGELLAMLDASGKQNDTIVVFSSEQGSQFPGNKWTNYNTGVHTALMVRWPGVVDSGTRSEALVQYADVLPTLLDAAGANVTPEQFDGTSFVPVLRGTTDVHRTYVYGVHNNVPEGPPYPIRSITDGRWHYILNLQNENLYIEKHLMGINGDGSLNNKYWQTWVFQSFDNPRAYELIQRYQSRPHVELYDMENDPYEMTNLAGKPETAALESKLRSELDRWLRSQADPGIDQDTRQSLRAARNGNHRFRPQ